MQEKEVLLIKAITVSEFGDPAKLKIVEKSIPSFNDEQLLIKVKATSVNYADIKMRNGTYPGKKKLPFTPGLELAGIVSEKGKNVEGFEVGESVIAFTSNGSYAEYVSVEKNLVFRKPEGIDFFQAASFPLTSFVAYDLVNEVGRLRNNESLLIHSGSGGVGSYAIAFAKFLGCQNIIVTVGKSHKIDFVKKLGAHHVIDYNHESIKEKVLEVTNGKGVNLIFNPIGGNLLSEDMDYLTPFGRIVYFGNASNQKGNIESDQLYPSSRSVIGYSFGKVREENPLRVQELAEKVLPIIENKDIEALHPKIFSINNASDAHTWMESREHTGKIVITM